MAVLASRPSTTSFMMRGTATFASLAAVRQASAAATRHLYSSRYGSRMPRARHSLPFSRCVGAELCPRVAMESGHFITRKAFSLHPHGVYSEFHKGGTSMGLRLKFNLVLLAVFVIGLGVTGYISYELLHKNARDEVLRNAGVMLEASLSMRQYTIGRVRPLLPYDADKFLPESVPAFAATEIMNLLRKKYPDYAYKEATLNPTNPRDRAVDWEADIVNAFRNEAARVDISGIRSTPTGRSLYLARPLQIRDQACLSCHTTAERAPPAMVKLYGPNNGFGWKMNEIIGAQIVSVPMDLPIRNANRAFVTFMSSLAAVFALLFVTLNVMLTLLIVEPITRLSHAAEQISKGRLDAAEIPETGRDEVSQLGQAFNRMRRSLEKAIHLIDKG